VSKGRRGRSRDRRGREGRRGPGCSGRRGRESSSASRGKEPLEYIGKYFRGKMPAKAKALGALPVEMLMEALHIVIPGKCS